MKDRFKFRFWFKDTQEMIYSEKFNDVQTLGQWLFEDRKDVVKMQCTGIKDKNCKLIYELDYIKYKKETYKLNIDKFLGITLTNILNGDIIVMDDLILFDCEVISNEFECNTKI